MPTLSPSRQARRPSLQPGVAPATRAFRQALPWLLGSLAATMSALIGQVPAWTLLVFTVSVGWRLFAERRRRPLPSLPVRLLVFLPMAFGVLWTFGGQIDAASMLAFLVALLSLKILELRSPRDFTVVSLLGYFMTLSAFFYNQSLALSVFLALSLFANTMALIRCHGTGETRVFWPTTRLALGMVAQSLPLVLLLFLIFPRVQGSFLRRLTNPNTGLTGMSDRLQPGSFGSLVQSDEMAFRAKLTADATLSQNQLYWRAVALEVCESSMSWRAAQQNPMPQRPVVAGNAGARVEQRITVMPHGEHWLFALDRPVEVKNTASFQGQLIVSDVVRSASPVVSTTIYTVVSDLASTGAARLSPERRRAYTGLPPDVSERVQTLVRGWRGGGTTDGDVVTKALAYLRDGGFSYTLTPGPLPADGALDYFLFRSRKGFCEHYAAAFSTLMRTAGIPARIVVGYQGGEFNTWGKYYTVRQSDAHAWTEVWLEGRGWQREDPTAMVAPDRVSYGAESYAALNAGGPLDGESRLDRLRRLNAPSALRWLGHNALLAWDSMDQQWNLLVLGFDQEQQFHFLQYFGLGDIDLLGGTVMSLAAVFTLLSIGAVGMRFVDRGYRNAPHDPARRLYDRFCHRLARAAGLLRAQTEGPLDYARRAGTALPDHAGEIDRITRLYIACRYAPPSGSADGAGALKEAVRRFRPTARATG